MVNIAKRLWFAAMCVAVTLTAGAEISVSVKSMQAGNMKLYINGQTDVTNLTVTGFIDVRDIDYISQELTELTDLDLSAARIEAYEGLRLLTGSSRSEANELPTMAFAGTKIRNIALPPELTAISDGALASTPIEEITFPKGVTRIGAGAFAGCSELTRVSLPAGLMRVGDNVFEGCTSLATATWNGPDIPANAFRGCAALATFKVGSPFYTIGAGAFAGCSSLKKVAFSSMLESIGAEAFRDSGLTAANMAVCSNLSSIGPWAFAGCTALQSVDLPTELTALSESIFFHAAALESLSGTENLTSVPTAAFKGNTALDNIDYAGQATEIGAYAFYGMDYATQFNLPPTLTAIGSHAFDGCESLLILHAPHLFTVPSLGDDVWGALDRTRVTLEVPGSMIKAFKAEPVWQDFLMKRSDDAVDEIAADTASDAINATLDADGLLRVVSVGAPLAVVEAYDVVGRTLGRWTPAADSFETILVAPHGSVVIVRALAREAQTPAVFKLVR